MATSLAFDSSSAANQVNERLLVLEDLLDLTERAQTHVRASGCAVAIRQGDSLIVRTSSGTTPEVGATLPCSAGVVGKCSQKPYCGSPAASEMDAALAALGVRSVLVVPIHANCEFVGVLFVTSQAPEAFSRMHVAILVTMIGEAGRLMSRLQALGQQSVPVPVAVPEKKAIESPAPVANTPPIPKPEKLAHPPKEIEVKRTAPVKPLLEPVPPARMATPDVPVTSNVAQNTAAMAAVKAGSEPIPSTGPDPKLLAPGEDPLKFGSVAAIKRPVPNVTFTTGTVYHGPVKRRTHPAKVISAAAVLVIATAAFTTWRHYSAAQPATPDMPHVSFAATPAVPVSAPEAAAASVHKPAAPVEAAVKPTTLRTESTKRSEAVESVAPKTVAEAPEPIVPAITIAAPAKPAEAQPAAVDAPSLNAVNVDARVSMPDLPALKVANPALVARKPVVAPPVLVHTVAPIYPEVLRRDGIGGEVHLRLSVSNKGSVVGVDSVDGPLPLRSAALAAVRQWQFRPATIDGQPVTSTVQAVVKFSK